MSRSSPSPAPAAALVHEPLPRRISVLGFARSGRALAAALADRGVRVAVGDRRPAAEFEGLEVFERRGVRFFFGGPSPDFLSGAGWLAVSPGVPPGAPAVRMARAGGIPVLSELEVAWRIAEAESEGSNRWVAVTGTNGKSTTASWIAEILRAAGRPVVLAGNIGDPLSSFLSERRPRDFVCEVSSFQLETIDRFRPHVAVLTNVTPDHMDRYGDFAEYVGAKRRVFSRQAAEDFAVLNADDGPSSATSTAARRVFFSRRGRPDGGGAWLESGALVADISAVRHEVIRAERLALPGAHNLENALAAVAAAECLGTPAAAMIAPLSRFRGLHHRTELVAESDGIRWIDDSKGTNVDATAKSLEGYADRSVLLILGGRDKHGDFPALRGVVGRTARLVLTIGEAAETIERALSEAAPVERCGTMDRAVLRARALARPGDTVLLSPACASFDQYENFEERGRHFAALARAAAKGV
jgi:UDP-N-acetylmuramoylalanine--D-glutamate ligase